LPDGTFQFVLDAYTNRNYVVESADSLTNWAFAKTVTQLVNPTVVTDSLASNATQRIYRARLAP
jgi:hypothetical protein